MLLTFKACRIRNVEISVRLIKASSRPQAKHFLLLNFNACDTKASQFLLSAIGFSGFESI
jgi:hypothetical protein